MRIPIATAKGTVEVEFGWRHLAEAVGLLALILIGVTLVFCFG